MRRLVVSSMRLTLLVCLPCGAGLFTLSHPLLQALFASQPRGVATAEPLLRLLGIAEPLVGLSAVTTAVLQSFGRPDLTVYAMTAGCSCKFAVSFWLAGQPDYHIAAAPIGTLVCYSVILLCNLACMGKLLGWLPPLGKALFRPLLASCGMAAFAFWLDRQLEPILGLRAAVLLTVCAVIPFYFILLTALHAWEAEDILPLPGGKQMARWMRLEQRRE